MSAFVIWETTNNKHYSTQLKTRKFFKYEIILTGCESEAKLELLHFIETVFVDSIVGYSSSFRTQSSVNCAAHTPIFVLSCSETVFKYNLTTDF